MNVLITGASGQLGLDLTEVCRSNNDEVTALSHGQLDISDRAAVAECVAAASPQIVFNCAAWTAVDDCESDPDRAGRINGDAVAYLAEAATASGAHLVQVSTDYVFDGTKTGDYTEVDPTNPQSVYGRSKLAGEQHALDAGASVVRTSWVYSGHGGNMVATILRLEKAHPELSFVSDQRGNPTFTGDLAVALRSLGVDRHSGLTHVTNAGAVSWHEFAQAVFAASGADPERVRPIATADLKPARPAPRPTNSVLSNERFAQLGHTPLRDFRDTLSEVVSHYEEV